MMGAGGLGELASHFVELLVGERAGTGRETNPVRASYFKGEAPLPNLSCQFVYVECCVVSKGSLVNLITLIKCSLCV